VQHGDAYPNSAMRSGAEHDLEHALFGRNADAQREAVVSSAAVNVQSIPAARPQAMIGHLRRCADHRVRQTQTEQAQVSAVGVSTQYEVGFALGNGEERTWIVQQPEAQAVCFTREARGERLQRGLAISPAMIGAYDLHAT